MRLVLGAFVATVIGLSLAGSDSPKPAKKKKDIRDYTEAELEHLFDEWEENDEEKLPEDELPEYKRPQKALNMEELRAKAQTPDEMFKMTKKGQTVMLFVGIRDTSKDVTSREFTDHWTTIWQSNLFNNHVNFEVFVIEDNRAIFMFKEGSQAWEAKDFLLKQSQVTEVTLEGRSFKGPAASRDEL